MASAPTTRPDITTEQTTRIYSPLRRLRGTIRRYVAWDSLALAVILLASWFWSGLVLDYGVFKLAGVDWVQILPWSLRLVLLVLVAGVIAIVLMLALRRLLREFRPEALALVLERRFPKLLGDKLITAVELSDLDKAETYGYSRAMILETVRDVSARVDQIPIGTVFNWGRLYRRFAWAGLLTVGLLIVSAAAYLGWKRTTDVADFGYRFSDVSSIWFERNVLLRNVLWPRRAYLEILDFPDSGELRIGRDAPSPRIRVRALKWVIADRAAPDGWRGLRWADLDAELLMGRSVPALPTALLVPPAEAGSAPGAADPAWSVDRVELALEQDDVRRRLSEEQQSALRGALEALDQKAAQASMSRRLRKLEVPREVKIYYWGVKSSDEAPMARQQQGVHEYAVVLTDLKESVKFYVKGEDYATYPYRRITLVPPPMLTKLEKDEFLPAYQYHRAPADGTTADLKGKKQVRLGQGVSLTGGTSRVEIASGSDLVLRGELDKTLSAARVRFRGANSSGETGRVDALEIGPDRQSIRIAFSNVTQPIEFDFEFTDTDSVKSLRHVIVQPIEDKLPDVNVAIETIRKVGGNYMCTTYAMIPIAGAVRDEGGLSRVEYALSYTRVESAKVSGLRAAIAAGILQTASASPSPSDLFAAPGLIDYLARLSESRESATIVPPIPLKTFEELLSEKDREYRVGKETLARLLEQAPPNLDEWRRQRMITQYDVKANLEWLDLQEKLPDLQRDLDAAIRPRYRMRLIVQAVDNNIETGPRTGQNKETFTFLVVPYEELLAEINKDEENLSVKSQELSDKMYDLRNTIDKVVERMPRQEGSDEFRAAASRFDELLSELEKGSDMARELLSDCQRLLKEGQANRLPSNFIENKEKITALLDEALRSHFEKARDAHVAFRDALQARHVPEAELVANSRLRQDELIRQIDQVRDMLGVVLGITKVAKELTEVIENRINFKSLVQYILQDATDRIDDSLGEVAPTADPVELRPGEKKIVTINFNRDGNHRGRLVVGLTAPAESGLTVPASVMAGRKSPNVQVEIAAGTRTGTFSVPVSIQESDRSPANLKDKKPLVLKVTVK